MSRIAALFLLVLLLTRGGAPGAPGTTSPRDQHLVRVMVSWQTSDASLPWQSSHPRSRSGYGVLLSGKRALTTERLVRNNTLVEISRPESAEKATVTVLAADPELNLALLEIDAPGYDVPPLDVIEESPTNPAMQALQMDEILAVQRVDAQLVQRRVTSIPDSPYSILSFNLLCNMNINGEGAPVFEGNRLAGLVMSYQPASRMGAIVSWPFLGRFVKGAENPKYSGTASAGFTWSPLVDPVKRRYLRVPPKGGILVMYTLDGAPAASVLKPGDLILEWDGHAIDELGFYDDPVLGRMEFSHLVKGLHSPGDSVKALISRDGATRNVSITLSGSIDPLLLVPENPTGEKAAYLVTGGFVLRELDGAFLRDFGGDWAVRADARLVQRYLEGNRKPHAPGQRVVFVSEVLPDPVNQGYGVFQNSIVTAVNGHPVRNMDDVFRVSDLQGSITRITLLSVGVDLVMDPAGIRKANEHLAAQYRITELQYNPGRRPAGRGGSKPFAVVDSLSTAEPTSEPDIDP